MTSKRKKNELTLAKEDPQFRIKGKLSKVSSQSGVYLMKNVHGKVIYVGKARSLKKRLASYFTRIGNTTSQTDMKTEILIRNISDFDTIITDSEKEALILESNLIKRFKPRYNVILKDDKRYPSLRLDINNPYPNLVVVRKIAKDGALYFGPFSSSAAVQKTLKIIHKTFKLRKCKQKEFKRRTRPCLNYQIGSCLGPCCLEINSQVYDDIVKEVVLFLKGRTPDLIKKIKQDMISAANVHEYEKAAVLRDKMFALEQTLSKQVAVTNDFIDRDVFGIAQSDENSMLTILFIRSGYLIGTRNFKFSNTMSTESEMIGEFIRQYYDSTRFVPKEILIPRPLEDAFLTEEMLSDIKGQKVKILSPKRGEKFRLIKLADQNAKNSLRELIVEVAKDYQLLVRLQQRLKMDRIPIRIECFDNSSISGKDAVSCMVVFENGKPNKSLYRKYRLKTATAKDDYACMAEVLSRRYGKKTPSEPNPDILMVDGGKGQLSIAVSVLTSLKLEKNIQLISIAKRNEKKGETQDKIYKPGQANPVNLGREGDLILFLERIRDEAHRFAISFHRKRRIKTLMNSSLDSIQGVGEKRKLILLKHFKSIKKIRAATLEELSALPGISYKIAEKIKNSL
ncbi:MAG TPA: excinuclease ABC subunit UvrC [Desulfobacterales bacterium]|nr:excinuclease ABC subunit UvrC [Desulfobacterales bacterium]